MIETVVDVWGFVSFHLIVGFCVIAVSCLVLHVRQDRRRGGRPQNSLTTIPVPKENKNGKNQGKSR